MKSEAAEMVVATAASKSTYAGAGSIIVGWLLSNEAAILIGMLVGLLGLLVNWHYKAKADRRAEESHRLFLERLRRGEATRSDLGELGSEG